MLLGAIRVVSMIWRCHSGQRISHLIRKWILEKLEQLLASIFALRILPTEEHGRFRGWEIHGGPTSDHG